MYHFPCMEKSPFPASVIQIYFTTEQLVTNSLNLSEYCQLKPVNDVLFYS